MAQIRQVHDACRHLHGERGRRLRARTLDRRGASARPTRPGDDRDRTAPRRSSPSRTGAGNAPTPDDDRITRRSSGCASCKFAPPAVGRSRRPQARFWSTFKRSSAASWRSNRSTIARICRSSRCDAWRRFGDNLIGAAPWVRGRRVRSRRLTCRLASLQRFVALNSLDSDGEMARSACVSRRKSGSLNSEVAHRRIQFGGALLNG